MDSIIENPSLPDQPVSNVSTEPNSDSSPSAEAQSGDVPDISVAVVGTGSAMAAGSQYQHMTHSLGLMFENAVSTQNNAFASLLSQTATSVKQTLQIDPLTGIRAFAKMLDDV